MNQRGAILLSSLIVLLIVASVAMTILVSSSALDEPSRRRTGHLHALYLAQSGLERAIAEVFTLQGDWTGVAPVPVPETAYASGSYRVAASLLEPDLAVLDVVGRIDSDSVAVTVIVERGPGAEVLVTGWDHAGMWGWAP